MSGPLSSQTVTFRDGEEQWTASIPRGHDVTRDVGITDDTTLAKFFERPVFTNSYLWTPGAGVFGQTFNPWSVFFNGSRVINRISNFNLMQAKLNVKFMINGNSFYYGRLMADYHVLPTFDQLSDVNALDPLNLIAASQRLHVFLDPTTSLGGTLKLPFIWFQDTLNIPDADWASLGQVYLREINSLKHANADTSPIEIVVSIWAEDVKLSVPTVINPSTLVAQDEYGDSPISAMASTVADAAGMLSSIPMIGPYAKATSTIANAMGSMAKFFGFSRPIQIENSISVRPDLISSLALTDKEDACAKLTLDSKQELSVDPRIFGIQAADELVLSHIAQIPSYITTFTWPISGVTNNILWNTYVTPKCVRTVTSRLYIPACTFASLPFKYWRGTMRYRFQIVASAFHKGRLRFVYDPGFVSGLESNVSITRIVDLANERDFTIDISWGNENHYLQHSSVDQTNFNTAAIAVANREFSNGVLGVYILNGLTAPSSLVNNDISINVFVSMCDDAEFAAPDSRDIDTITFAPLTGGPAPGFAALNIDESMLVEPAESVRRAESEYFVDESELEAQDEVSEIEPDSNTPMNMDSTEKILKCLPPADHTTDVYFGERVTSFRQVLKRYAYHTSYKFPTTTLSYWNLTQKNFPMYRGEVSTAITQKIGAIPYNFSQTTLLNYITPAYTGVRGSLRSKYLFFSDVPSVNSQSIITRNNTPETVTNSLSAIAATNPSSFASAQVNLNTPTLAGSHAVSLLQNPTIEVEFPYYTNRRFDAARSITLSSANSPDATHRIVTQFNATVHGGVARYISTGEDFQLFLFQGMPPYYKRANVAPV